MAATRWEPAAAGRRDLAWVALLAFAVVAAGLLARGTGSGGTAGTGTLPITAEADGQPAAPPEPAEGWERLGHAPLVRRHGHSAVWTGSEVVFWGGARSDERWHRTGLDYLRSGASYRPRTGLWRRLPAAPLPGRTGHVAVWAGREMLVWGGTGRGTGPAGGAYDPVRRRWRVLAPGPVDAARSVAGAWTGRTLLVWGTLDGRWVAASYDPARDAWERLPDPPVEVAAGAPLAVWAADRLVLWSAADGDASAVATWDRVSSSWSVAGVAQAPAPAGLLAAGRQVVAWGGDRPGWALSYDPVTGERRPFARPPPAPQGLVSAWDGRHVVAWAGERNEAFLLDPATGALTALPGAPLDPRTGAAGAWTGDSLVIWGGASSDRHHADGAVLRPPG